MTKKATSIMTFTVVLLIVLLASVPCESAIDGSVLADELNRVATAVGMNFMQNKYDEIGTQEKKVNGQEIINQISLSLTNKFKEMADTLEDVRTSIESTYSSFTSSPLMRECCNIGELPYDIFYRAKIDRNNMCVTISDASPPTRKFPPLDVLEVMKSNQNKIPDLRWQYFASEDGLLLNYPATAAGFTECGSYDPRFRPFYVSTATPMPKDVVIVMDSSDSMQGTMNGKVRLQVAKDAAITVIKTLNPVDRVGFVTFNDAAETPSSINPCFDNSLALVTAENVDDLKTFINSRQAKGETNYEQALLAAFKFFNNTQTSLRGEYRDKVILFLTDGENAHGRNALQVIKELNEPLNNSVIIHTFGLGSGFADDLLVNMSKQTLNDPKFGEIKVGRFERITDADRLRTAMATYYQYFAHASSTTPIFTTPYIDIFSEVGLILSMCVPVNDGGKFVGVTCTDIEVANLLSDITYLSKSETSYMFMIDSFGRTLVHPLLPIHQKLLPDVVDIHYFEKTSGVEAVLESMMMKGKGNTTLSTKIVQQRGEMIREGDEVRDVMAHYVWTPVERSDFSVCFVISVDEKQTMLPSRSPSPDMFVYHNRVLRPGPYENCYHYSRLATADKTGVMLTPSAFEKPYKYLDEPETQGKIVEYEKYFRGVSSYNPGLKPSVLNSVNVTYSLEDLWKRNNYEAQYIVWRYITTADGVVRMYPAVQMRKDYDHTRRAWYQRTLANKGTTTISMPYVDLWGSGLVITMSRTILQGRSNGQHSKDDSAVAVMGTDFPIYYFDQILRSKYSECSDKKYSCIIIDNSGFLVMHPDFIETTNDPNLNDPIHITTKEGKIAMDLLTQGILYKQKCVDVENKKKQTTYRVSLTSNPGGIDRTAQQGYELRPVPGSTIFFILKSNTGNSDTCCTSTTAPDERECVGTACDCLCYEAVSFKQCENKYSDGERSSETCSARRDDLQYSEPDDSQRIKGLQQCFSRGCSCRKTREDCYSVAGCSWCTERYDGNTLDSNSFCDLQDTCPFRKCTATADCRSKCGATSGPPDESKQSDVGTIVAIVVPIVIVIIIVVLLVVYCTQCRYQKPDPSDDYLDAIDESQIHDFRYGAQNGGMPNRSFSVSSNTSSQRGQLPLPTDGYMQPQGHRNSQASSLGYSGSNSVMHRGMHNSLSNRGMDNSHDPNSMQMQRGMHNSLSNRSGSMDNSSDPHNYQMQRGTHSSSISRGTDNSADPSNIQMTYIPELPARNTDNDDDGYIDVNDRSHTASNGNQTNDQSYNHLTRSSTNSDDSHRYDRIHADSMII